jgi:hypothetical protein
MNVLFVINTEGQLLSAASLIFERFNMERGYNPIIIQVEKKGFSRLSGKLNAGLLSSSYVEVDAYDKKLKKKLKHILLTEFEKVFIFLEQLNLSVFLAYYFKQKGSIICLGPDGNKPYYKITKNAWASRFQETFKTYKILFSRGLYLWKPYFLSWNYAHLKEIDEVWVTYPKQYINRSNKEVVGFTIFPNKGVTKKINELFYFNIHNYISKTEDVIFYANNILYKRSLYDIEIDTIRQIKDKFPQKRFYIKYHPGTPDFQIEAFKELGVDFFSNAIPAELFIANLNRSIIMGFWSAALMINNPSCKFYWLHNYLKTRGQMINYIDLTNPTNYIQDVDSIEKIAF